MQTLFFHGLHSNKETTKYQAINYPKFCETVYYESYDYELIHNKYNSLINLFKPDILIGHSLGGYWSLKLAIEHKLPCILLNPQLFPQNKDIFQVDKYQDFLNFKLPKDILVTMYIETDDDIIDVDRTITLLDNNYIIIQEGGHHKLQYPERVNDLIDYISKNFS